MLRSPPIVNVQNVNRTNGSGFMLKKTQKKTKGKRMVQITIDSYVKKARQIQNSVTITA